ncbi:hypothetical protein [Noviherbaspirillum galbum]|uniref:PrcB C-terminal domain-containing protein n=1 Tax=Noviherbaspirillum galbum TaxID=2709383 RepID=A0A6B3SQU2_9BURK|nr:hypothetical protein [Noviherbaspirillum galbum]NEX63123.1 hypothetical protein [Noviherbaspirillum galbum]
MKNKTFLALFALALLSMSLAACGGSSSAASGNSLSSGGESVVPGNNTGNGGDGTQAAGTAIAYRTLGPAPTNSRIMEERLSIVKDADAWNRLWSEHSPQIGGTQAAPAVDFARNMVVAVFLGSRSPCGTYAIESVAQNSAATQLDMRYRVTPPRADTACIALAYFPAFFLEIPRSSLPVQASAATARADADLLVRTGWSYGMCLDRCEGEAEITQADALLRVGTGRSLSGGYQGISSAVTAQEWTALADAFRLLPDLQIGCPGCADEGREWIEVRQNGVSRRLELSCGTSLPATSASAAGVVAAVRSVRGRLAAALGLGEPCASSLIAFDRIVSPVLASAIGEKRTVVVRDAAAWTALWQQHAGSQSNAPAPAVDFSRRMVLAVFLGKETPMCGGMNIVNVVGRAAPERIEAQYRVLDPGPDVVCVAASINLASFVSVPASPVPVEFIKLP